LQPIHGQARLPPDDRNAALAGVIGGLAGAAAKLDPPSGSSNPAAARGWAAIASGGQPCLGRRNADTTQPRWLDPTPPAINALGGRCAAS